MVVSVTVVVVVVVVAVVIIVIMVAMVLMIAGTVVGVIIVVVVVCSAGAIFCHGSTVKRYINVRSVLELEGVQVTFCALTSVWFCAYTIVTAT